MYQRLLKSFKMREMRIKTTNMHEIIVIPFNVRLIHAKTTKIAWEGLLYDCILALWTPLRRMDAKSIGRRAHWPIPFCECSTLWQPACRRLP